jgi:hypothetical protein
MAASRCPLAVGSRRGDFSGFGFVWWVGCRGMAFQCTQF